MKILIADDDDSGRGLLREILCTEGHDVMEAVNGREALKIASLRRPDLVISDGLMPVMDGFQFLRSIKSDENLRSIPFILYSSVYDGDDEYRLAVSLGAEAVISKPKAPSELLKEINEILNRSGSKASFHSKPGIVDDGQLFEERHTGIMTAKLEEKIIELEREVAERKRSQELHQKGKHAFLNMLEDINESYKELEDLFLRLITAMVNTLDAKSPWTKGHSERVAEFSETIARKMGLDDDGTKDIRLAGILHDLGKIGTYDYLLDKPSKLTDEEFIVIKRHPAKGAEILSGIKQLKKVIPLIRHHHERIDGKGYPDGLAGDEIPLGARILHVADSFDSMTADRPYRKSPGTDYAISELMRWSGSQFDSNVVAAFLEIIPVDKL